MIFRNLKEIDGVISNAAVTVGNFDGVHLGHQEIFSRVRSAARALGGPSVVVTFVPHPLKLFPSHKSLQLITPYAEKENLIKESGVDYLVVIPFSSEFAAIQAREFVSEILVGQIGMKKLIVGYDYSFGRNREGNVQLLADMADELDYELEVLGPIGKSDVVYSSTGIRKKLCEGEVKAVVSLMGRHFSITGTVIHGHHRGKGLGYPTANLATENEIALKKGVYAVKVLIDDKMYDGACNIGNKPTFLEESTTIEVFVIDLDLDLYGKSIKLFFVDRVRDEIKFPNAASLVTAISEDIVRCRELLGPVTVTNHLEAK